MSCYRSGIAAALLALALAAPASAQVAPARSDGAIIVAQAALGEETPAKRRSRKRDGASKREPTVNQTAASASANAPPNGRRRRPPARPEG